MPSTSTIFERELSPARILTARRGTAKELSQKFHELFVSGPVHWRRGDSRILSESPWTTPVISLRDARGCTRTEKRTRPFASRKARARSRNVEHPLHNNPSANHATRGVMSIMPIIGITRRSGASIHSVVTYDQRIHFEYGEIGSQDANTRTRGRASTAHAQDGAPWNPPRSFTPNTACVRIQPKNCNSEISRIPPTNRDKRPPRCGRWKATGPNDHGRPAASPVRFGLERTARRG